MMANQPDNTSLILIGKSGHGKSATGNSILGRRAFETSSGLQSGTTEVTDAWAVEGLTEIHVIDGPGLVSTDLDRVQDKEQACVNMTKALMLCNGGVHAFVLVIKFGIRLTEEEMRTISDLKQIFGKSYLKDHGIIVFTGGDQFADAMEEEGTPAKTFTEWFRDQKREFRNLFQECSPRIVMFNNKSKSEEEKTRQRNELLRHVQELRRTKGLYTNEHFQVYAQVREKMIQDNKLKMLEEALQKRIDLLSAELEQISKNSSVSGTDVDRLDARIKDVYTEIGEDSQQKKPAKRLIACLKKMSNTTKELRTAIDKQNVKDIEKHLATLSKCNNELKRRRQIPWGDVLSYLGMGLGVVASILILIPQVGVGVIAAGLAFSIGSGATYLLGKAYNYLKNKQ